MGARQGLGHTRLYRENFAFPRKPPGSLYEHPYEMNLQNYVCAIYSFTYNWHICQLYETVCILHVNELIRISIKSIQSHTTDIQSKVLCDIQFFAWDCRYCPTTPYTSHICQLYVKLCMACVKFCMCHIKLDIQLTYM